MATELSGGKLVRAEVASADLSAKMYYFVELDGNDQIAVCNAAGDFAVGVLEDDRADAQYKTAQVVYFGPCKVVASAAITRGALITTTDAGKAVTVSPNGGAGDVGKAILGRALSTATADGQIISAVINCINPAAAT